MTSSGSRRKKEISAFYREEFVRHRSRLETQRSFFSEDTISEIEDALDKIIEEIDRISQVENFNELASHLLHRIDAVTTLSSSRVNPAYRVH